MPTTTATGSAMPNKRFQDMLDEDKRARQRREELEELKAHPMTPQEAARMICLIHTLSDGRPNVGVIPDFAKFDGELYEEAWRVLRRFGGLDSDEPGRERRDSDSKPA